MTGQQKPTDKPETVEIPIGGISVEYGGNIGNQEQESVQEMGGLEHLALDPHTVSLERLSTPDIPQEPVSEMELLCGNVIKLGEGTRSIEVGSLADIVIEDMKYPKLNQEQIMRLTRTREELRPKIELMRKGAESGLETCGDIYTEWKRIDEDFFSGDKFRPIYELETRIAKVGLMSLNFSDKGDGRIRELLTYIEKINEKMLETYRLISREQESKEQEEKPETKSQQSHAESAYI